MSTPPLVNGWSEHRAGNLARIDLGLQHEQQHQELLLTDIKHAFWCNPMHPAYRPAISNKGMSNLPALRFIAGHEGVAEIGHTDESFAFDNETPRHRTWLSPHALLTGW